MKKSVVTRFRLTKTNKVLRRKMAVDHFRTRKTKKNIRRKKLMTSVDYPLKKIISY